MKTLKQLIKNREVLELLLFETIDNKSAMYREFAQKVKHLNVNSTGFQNVCDSFDPIIKTIIEQESRLSIEIEKLDNAIENLLN